MKKKIIIGLLIAVCITAAAFAQETENSTFRVSLGAGGMLNANFSTWFVDKDVPGDLNRYNSSTLGTTPYVFVDLKYIELNVGLGIGKTGGLEQYQDDIYTDVDLKLFHGGDFKIAIGCQF